jgi:deoxyribose-phosphate aldolase
MANKNRKISLSSDHGGFSLKEILKEYLSKNNYTVDDCGTFSTDSVDYPVFASAVAQKVSKGESEFGIIVDGAGIGSCMVANKFDGVRAALCYDISSAKNAREHNNANVLTLGAGLVGSELAKQIVFTFLKHECTAERHLRRVKMIDDLDKKKVPMSISEKISEVKEMDLSSTDISQIARKVGELLNTHNPSVQHKSADHCTTDMICKCGICIERKPETIRQFIDYGVDRIGYHDATGAACVPEDIAKCIDHTILKPDATEEDIKKLCAEAREFQFASVCISPSYIPIASKELASTNVKVCTVVGFPSGAHMPEIKAMETRRAIRDGATEIDMVINIGALKSGNDDLVYQDIRMVCEACEDGGAISKVIIEASLLTNDEKVRACELSKKARANFVKTSTGFGPGGATSEDVSLMSKVVADAGIGVKAAGGIKTFEDAQKMVSAGATRLGASAGIKIVHEAKEITVSN